MSAISLKSITGITSITTPAGVDNQLTLHNNNTTEAVKLDIAGNLHFHNHLNITGVSTASNFKTGTSNLHNTGLNVQDLDVDGHTNLDNTDIVGILTVTSTTQYGGYKLSNNSSIVGELVGLSGSNDTGALALWSGGSKYIQLSAQGNSYITGGSVGINELSPDRKLHVRSDGAAAAKLGGESGAAYYMEIGQLASSGSPGFNATGSSASMLFQLNGSEIFRIASTGNIEVKDSAVNLSGNAPSVKGKIRIGGVSDSTTAGGIEFHTSSGGGGGYGTRITSDASANMHFLTRSNHSAWSEKVRITSGGQVCIGTNTAVRALSIKDPGQIYLESTSTGNWSGIQIKGSSGTNNYNAYFGILDSNGNFFIDNASNGDDFVITQSGNIGVAGATGTDFSLLDGMVINTDNGDAGLIINSSSSSHNAYLSFGYGSGSGTSHADQYSAYIGRVGDDTLILGTQNNIRATLTSGGQFVVGGTSSQASDAVTLMPDGEVTAAGFYFSNNIGSAMNACGIRRHTTNTMVFDTASTERVRIDADGNTSTKGSALEHFVNKRVQAIAQNGNYVQYVLICPTGTNDVRLQGKFHFTRAAGTSGNAQQTVEAQLMTNNSGGDAQYYVRTTSTDQGAYAGMYYRWVTCTYNSTTYYALEGHPISGSSYWGGFMQHGVFTGTANACSNLGTVLNTGSHSITNITALTSQKAHERWYNTTLNVQAGGLYVKQNAANQAGYFAPLYYDTNGAALPTSVKVHGQKAVCIDATRYYTSGDIIVFRINNDYEGAIYVSPSGVNYNSTSDYRLKENVIDLTGAIDRVKQLKPKRFNFIKEPGNTMDGFMAHEVSGIVPNAVMGEKDAVKDILYEENDEVIPEGKKIGDVKEKNAIDPQTMDDSKLVPLLTAALQEAIAKIETLETKVAALEGS